MTQKKIPWDELELIFIEGIVNGSGEREYPSLKKVSEMYNLNYASVRRKAAKGQWSDKKKNRDTKVAEKIEIHTERDAIEIVAVNETVAKATRLGITVSMKLLEQKNEELEAGQKVKSYDLVNTSQAIKNFYETFAASYGENVEILKIQEEQQEDSELLQDPGYIKAKAEAMSNYYENKKK